jgi:hypothetical protein
MANAAADAVTFSIQETGDKGWRRAIDTGNPAPEDFIERWEDMPAIDGSYEVKGRSVVVLMRLRG